MKQEIIEKYLIIQAEKELESYQLKQFIREIADTRPYRENKLWLSILKEMK
jgi:hypothetical protein